MYNTLDEYMKSLCFMGLVVILLPVFNVLCFIFYSNISCFCGDDLIMGESENKKTSKQRSGHGPEHGTGNNKLMLLDMVTP